MNDGNSTLKNFMQILFENLGEEYPDVLATIIKAMYSIIKEIGIEDLEPPISDILPTLTPILKNRNELV